MKSLNRPQNQNTAEYWDGLYQTEDRSGWWTDGLRPFLIEEIGAQVTQGHYRYIEIGGGMGYAASLINAEFPDLQCWNVDFSAEAIQSGREKYPEVTHICHDVLRPFPAELHAQFDILVCQEVIEHLENPPLGIQNMMRLVAEGGLVCFTFPYGEGEQDGFLHLWSFNYTDIIDLFFPHAREVTLCRFVPPSKSPNLWGCIKFNYEPRN